MTDGEANELAEVIDELRRQNLKFQKRIEEQDDEIFKLQGELDDIKSDLASDPAR